MLLKAHTYSDADLTTSPKTGELREGHVYSGEAVVETKVRQLIAAFTSASDPRTREERAERDGNIAFGLMTELIQHLGDMREYSHATALHTMLTCLHMTAEEADRLSREICASIPAQELEELNRLQVDAGYPPIELPLVSNEEQPELGLLWK